MEHEEDVPEPQSHAVSPPDGDAHDDAWFDEPADGPAHRGVRPSRRNVLVAAVGAVAIAAAAVVGVNAISSGSSSATAASATRNGPGGRGGPPGGGDGGTIQSVNGSTIVVKNRSNKTETVQTSASTTVTEAVKGSLSAVKVGDHVVVLGSTSGSAVTASQIVDNGTASNPSGPPGGQQPPNGASGSSSSGSASSNGPSGSGGPPGGPASQSGSNPSGSSAPSGSAQSGNAQSGNGPQGGAPTMGTVTAVNGSTITVQSTSGSSVSVSTSASTIVLVTKTGSVSDLTVGEQIMVRGTSSSGTITATSIREGDVGPPPGAGSGNAGGPGSSS
jgi:hypothetical protein